MPRFAKVFAHAAPLAVSAALAIALAPSGASAFGDEPAKPKIDCSKKANKSHPACKNNRDGATDDEVYNAAYWLAKSGSYAEARALLLTASNPDDPRILNYLGYTTRKLGDVDGALVYYGKALALKPDYTLARSYLGEAHLQKGDVTAAKSELGEIERRCGTGCQEYAELAGHIDRFERSADRGD